LDLGQVVRGGLRLETAVVDVHDLVGRVVGICGEDLRSAGLQLELDLAASAPHVAADAGRLQQVLWNLLKNAAKFTPPGGRVAVRTRNEGRSAGTDGPGPRLLVDVSDTGLGIEPSVLSRIFDAFEQGEAPSWSRRAGGLGLGLAIARSIAEAHGGRLVATSAGANQGSTFTLELVTVAAPAAEAGGPPAAANAPSRGRRILMVEDDAATLQVMARLLRGRGHTVLTASSLAAGLAVAAREEFDLVVSDLGLPDGNGLELMRRLREDRPVTGIAVSGFGMAEDVAQSREAGFVEHLTKPVDLGALEAAIQRISRAAGV